MKTMAHPAKRCQCPQHRADRYVDRFFLWCLAPFAFVMLVLQIARAGHVWPFA